MGIRWGVKLTVVLEPAASESPCSISGTEIQNNNRGYLVNLVNFAVRS